MPRKTTPTKVTKPAPRASRAAVAEPEELDTTIRLPESKAFKLDKGPTVMGVEDFGDDEDEKGFDTTGNPTDPEEDVPAAPVTETDAISRLAQSIDKFVSVQNDNAPIKRVPWAQYKPKTVFNPTGNKKRVLTRRLYQNQNRLFIPLLHDEEISLLNQLQPGLSINGLVAVHEVMNGQNTDLHIRYSNATNDQRMTNLQEWRNLTELLRRCITEGPIDPSKISKRRRAS